MVGSGQCLMLGLLLAGPAVAQAPNVGPPIRIDVAGGTGAANETTAAASEFDPMEVVAAWNDWRESPPGSELIRMGVALSLDGGASWTDFVLRPPVANQSGVEGDPMTAFDDRTGALWVGAISFAGNGGVFIARKDHGSAVFEPSVMADATGSADKCWMAAGPRPGLPDTTRLYITYNLGVIWSDDFGGTFTNPSSLGSGIGFLPRIGPEGELYIAYWDFSGGGLNMRVQRSLNGGASFTNHVAAVRMDSWGVEEFNTRFAGTFRVAALLSLDVDPNDGTLYAVYPDTTEFVDGNANVDLYFTTSADQGTTWSVPVVVNGDGDPPGDQFFPWLEVDQTGRIHMVFFDSRHTPQDDNVVNGMFDAYYSFSDDGGASWTEVRLTPNSWNSERDGLDRPAQFIGDYLGVAVAGNRIYPVYLDTSNGDTDTYTNVITYGNSPDFNGDGFVTTADLLQLLSAWGPCADCGNCPEDLDGDCNVATSDLLILLEAWGPLA